MTGQRKIIANRQIILKLYVISDNLVCVKRPCTVFDNGPGRNRLNDTKLLENDFQNLPWGLMFPGIETYLNIKSSAAWDTLFAFC